MQKKAVNRRVLDDFKPTIEVFEERKLGLIDFLPTFECFKRSCIMFRLLKSAYSIAAWRLYFYSMKLILLKVESCVRGEHKWSNQIETIMETAHISKQIPAVVPDSRLNFFPAIQL